jgi:transcriptional regulator with PAS, ATPase and Fis domain
VKRENFEYKNLIHAINHMNGTLLICDRNRNVVFYNDMVMKALAIPEELLSGANLMDLADKKYIINSASIQAFETGKLSIKYVQGRMSLPILTISTPVLDENGDVDYVVALSVNEEIFEIANKEMVKARNKDLQIQNYLSSEMLNRNSMVVCECEAMKNVLRFLCRCAQNDGNLLLTGETGVGKEVLAKYTHRVGTRSEAIFIPVNCAAIPEPLMESEFFGYIHGAFTGADKNGKIGFFEMADGGTLFLDEIGELPLALQAKLLRVIEMREVTRLGSTKVHKVDFRLIAATNRDLEKMCKEGAFREDLYYRLNILSVEIPPLRKRREDIIPLAKHFIAGLNKKHNTSKILSHAAIKRFENYDWPGNVRELRNVIERLMLASDSDILDLDDLNNKSNTTEMRAPDNGRKNVDGELAGGRSLKSAVDDFEWRVIQESLNACDCNISVASEKLGIDKSSLYRKIQKHKNSSMVYENRYYK